LDFPSDAELIEKFRQGQTESFNILVWRWQNRLLNFLYRYLGNRTEAEDICQMTFLKAFQKLKRLQDTQKFSTWLYRIALNQARDFFRRKRNRPVFSLHQTFGEDSDGTLEAVLATDSQPAPDVNLQHKEMQVILQQSLQKISEDQRAVIVLKIFDGLKFSEIADILKIPEGTAKTRLYTGLKSLRTVLEQSHLDKEVWKS